MTSSTPNKNQSRCQRICLCELKKKEVTRYVTHKKCLLFQSKAPRHSFHSHEEGGLRLIEKGKNHIFKSLAMVPNYARAQSSFREVYVWLCHAAGALFTGCFQNHFSTLQLNVISAIEIRMSTKTNQQSICKARK